MTAPRDFLDPDGDLEDAAAPEPLEEMTEGEWLAMGQLTPYTVSVDTAGNMRVEPEATYEE